MNNLENNNEHFETLIHAYLSGVISQEEKDELFVWIIKDPENVKYFNHISDIWLSASAFHDNKDFDENEAFDRIKAKIDFVNNDLEINSQKKVPHLWLKIAAIIIPTIIISSVVTRIIFSNEKKETGKSFLFEVPYGSKGTILLPDNSKVILNAGTKLMCDAEFGKTHRTLKLVGEGYFKVFKNKDLPFVVRAGNLDVQALGTEFNVKAYPSDKNIEAVLIEGAIKIKKTIARGTGEPSVVLKSNQSLVYSKNKDSFQVNVAVEKNTMNKQESPANSPKIIIKETNIDQSIYTTWKDGSWVIYQKELSDLAIDLERKYDVKIRFGSEELKKMKVTGNLPDISLEQVLSAIRLISPIEYKINGKEVELAEDKSLIPLYKKYYKSSDNN